ncbi:MAG TPA: hypothetical protein VE010_06650 [Thermoanaerobaculia bacterium]|nr:hypothetical protein [Thermoanaerobaculia bacterium]
MNDQSQRITLIARKPNKPDVDWNYTHFRSQRVAFVDSMNALRFALGAALHDVGLDVERIIVDRAGAADDFLDLLAGTPTEFAGDVLMIRDDRGGFLSATGRGGDRVLYALSAYDIRFYLETHDLVTGRALEMTA